MGASILCSCSTGHVATAGVANVHAWLSTLHCLLLASTMQLWPPTSDRLSEQNIFLQNGLVPAVALADLQDPAFPPVLTQLAFVACVHALLQLLETFCFVKQRQALKGPAGQSLECYPSLCCLLSWYPTPRHRLIQCHSSSSSVASITQLSMGNPGRHGLGSGSSSSSTSLKSSSHWRPSA